MTPLTKITSNIWVFYITEKLWIWAAHISDASNEEADKQYSIFDKTTDRQLNLEPFKEICERNCETWFKLWNLCFKLS